DRLILMVKRKVVELGLWSWDTFLDLDLKPDVAEGVPGAVGDVSNSLKSVDPISKSNEVESNDVVCDVKKVIFYCLNETSVYKCVNDDNDLLAMITSVKLMGFYL
ncbi:hypothetical protein Tco_0037334, partial [Tanacetum coccineum]